MRNIDVPTDISTDFEFRDSVADIQRRTEEREQNERGGQGQSQEGRNSTVTERGAVA